jgi:hypothetical protein
MEAPHLLLDLLDDGVHLQVVDGRLHAEFPAGTRTPDRAEAIRSHRDHLIDLTSRSAAEILATLREAGLIISLEGGLVRVKGCRIDFTAELRALIRFHKAEIVNELSSEPSYGLTRLDTVNTMVGRLREFASEELDAYRLELINSSEDDPPTRDEWAALARAKRIRAGGVGRYIECECGTSWDRVLIPACPTCSRPS